MTFPSAGSCLAAAALALLAVAAPAPAAAQQSADAVIVDAREALRRGDRNRLASLRTVAVSAEHPLAQWVDYWDLSSRLNTATAPEVEAFYTRWSSSYVEDRLRNDWLLELGRRRDWIGFGRDFPHFRMNDDREVSCYALLTQALAGIVVKEAAQAAWSAQRDADEGCHLLASHLVENKQFGSADIWAKARQAVEFNRPRAARAAAALVSAATATAIGEVLDNPARYVTRRPHAGLPGSRQLLTLAVMRMAGNDPEAAAAQLEQPWARELTPEMAATAWGAVAKQAALKLMPGAAGTYQRAWALQRESGLPPAFTDDWLAWNVRAALRLPAQAKERWPMIATAVDAMSAPEQKDPAWVYWKARAVHGRAAAGPGGDAARAASQQLLASIVSPLTFYGQLAIEDLGQRIVMPAVPAALSAAERVAAAARPGFDRALQLIQIGLRGEGVREWNFTLRGLNDRELLAAAQRACEREIWDRCINSSDRSRTEIDLAQRYPTPYRAEVVAAARDIGLDPAYVYGLIRQESRFIMDARSHVGASGLMQLMPATARWTAKKIGLDFKPEMITQRDVNLKLGTAYLKLVLDDFGGSAPMAAAAYNAGPSRPRRWREGAVQEAAAWAEGIPFNETRDYVKKVLSNATVYAALLQTVPVPALKTRLGNAIGPREAAAPATDKELP